MPVDKQSPSFVRLRVLAEHNSDYNVCVATCLETGSVVTADDETTVVDMMKELLEDEISFAVRHRNYANLLSSPASADVWARWFLAAKQCEVETLTLNIDAAEVRLDKNVPSRSDLEVARVCN